MNTALKNLACFGITLALLSGFAFAQSVTGTVTNKTNNKPSGNDDVVLLQLAQGMQELARTKTDSRGRFTIEVPGQGLHLLRVTHDKANYFQPVQPGTDTVNIDVYSAAPQVAGVTLDADVMRIETNAAANSLRVVEHFFVKNNSTPPKTLMSDHPFQLFLPAGATLEGSAAKSPGGMAVQQGLVPETEANKFTILFPIRPGETEFQVTYQIPYSPDKGYTFQPRPVMATDNLVLMLPKAMTYKPGQSAPYAPVGDEEVGAQTYVARNAQPSQPLSFTLTGSGQLPRDSAPGAGTPAAGVQAVGAQGAGGQGAPTSGQPPSSAASDPSTDTRPGGGIGVPVDKDAERDPWTKYRWWIIAALGFIFAAAAGFMLKAPSGPAAGKVPTGPDGVLQVMRDELFAVETDRLSGKLTEAEYLELKSAFDIVLKRTLSRQKT